MILRYPLSKKLAEFLKVQPSAPWDWRAGGNSTCKKAQSSVGWGRGQGLPGGTGSSATSTARPALWARMASWYCYREHRCQGFLDKVSRGGHPPAWVSTHLDDALMHARLPRVPLGLGLSRSHVVALHPLL